MATSEERLRHAFDVAEKHLHIEKFLDPEGQLVFSVKQEFFLLFFSFELFFL